MKNRKTSTIKMTINPTTAALGRAIFKLGSEAGKMRIEASLARSNGENEHARFFASRESQAIEDANLISELIGFLHNENETKPNERKQNTGNRWDEC